MDAPYPATPGSVLKREIQIRDVGMVYDNGGNNFVTALQDITLDIYKGEFISLLGPSGCGKTTLLRMIADLIQPTSGEILVDGVTPREARRARKYGMVFQSPVLYEWRTVRRNIELPLEIMKISKAERRVRSDQMLELVGLQKFADHYPSQLSGGMQQRVGIARALGLPSGDSVYGRTVLRARRIYKGKAARRPAEHLAQNQ